MQRAAVREKASGKGQEKKGKGEGAREKGQVFLPWCPEHRGIWVLVGCHIYSKTWLAGWVHFFCQKADSSGTTACLPA
jgi:hypothetical protein